jgi:hypothetical protein
MATQLCQKCKQAHPGRVCDYDEKGDCTDMIGVKEVAQTFNERSNDEEDGGSLRSGASKRPELQRVCGDRSQPLLLPFY